MCKIKRAELHWHHDYSNIRLPDSTNTIKKSILKANEMGLAGMAITDHESLGGHVKAIKTVEALKEEGKIEKDFKLVLGNEIYLVGSLEEVRDNYVGGGVTKFPHFLLLAKNAEGHEALRKLSSIAWSNSFYTGTMERVPTTMEDLARIAKEHKGTLIASSACLGSFTSICLLALKSEIPVEEKEVWQQRLFDFIEWNIDVFGKEDFYLELQPSADYEQRTVNEGLVKLAEMFDLKLITTNDVHYLRPEDRKIHSAYLNSKQEERETDSFYAHTYLHEVDEMFNKLHYLDQSIVEKSFENTIEIIEKCEEYSLEAPTKIPVTRLPEFEVQHLFHGAYDKYEYIAKMAHSEEEQDRYLLHLVEDGFLEMIPYQTISKEYFHKVLARIDVELEQLWKISEKMNQAMSSYYVTTAKIVNLIWGDDCGEDSRTEGSLLGSGRGSAVAWITNYLLGITQVNPLDYGIEIPYWRHLNHLMGDVSSLDIDLDVTSTKKKYIINRMKDFYGEDKVVAVCTYGKEKPKSAINTACRGLGLDSDIGQYIGSFIPFERGEHWSLTDCLYGNPEEGREPVKQFINEIEKYEGLKETALNIEGLINKRSIHAGGILVLNEPYFKSNALMKAPNGELISQFNLDYSQACGSIKFDVLTIEANDKLQTVIELLLDYGEIEWQGTLRKTFNKYFHPEVIDKTSPHLYDLISEDKVPDLFQFSTALAQSVIKKSKPSNLIETTAINSIMRLMSDGKEQPIDTFVKFKENPELAYEEMRTFGLDDEDIAIFEKHLRPLNFVADTQESVMLMAMDEKISGFDLYEATKLRKGIAKKKKEASLEIKELLYKKAEELGNKKERVDYLWHQIERMLSYAFSLPHTLAYSLIALEEVNIFNDYNPLYWQTACLTVNSGSQEVSDDTKEKSTNYGKIASAIGKLKSYDVNVSLPDINYAKFAFTPDTENDRIVYSLKGIVGINDETVGQIIENRPYASFEDFYDKMYETGLLKKAQMVKLIKAGCFNEFDSQLMVMKQFIMKLVDVKTSLNMQNLKSIIRLGLLDGPEFHKWNQLFEIVFALKDNTYKVGKDKYFAISYDLLEDFIGVFGTADGLQALEDGSWGISEKEFKKMYDKILVPFKDIINKEDFIRAYNNAQFFEIWGDLADGTVAKWQMESVSYYNDEHELDGVDKDFYGITNFFDLDVKPKIIGMNNFKGRQFPIYETYTLIGTVLDRDKNKKQISVLTPNGVITVKAQGGSFSHYDKTISRNVGGKKQTIEKSWFTRGNLVMLKGYRREDQFVLKTYSKGSEKEHTVQLITDVREDGTILIKSERERV